MVNPRSVSRPDAVSVATIEERETDEKLTEYIKFTAPPDADETEIEAFVDELQERCSEWDVHSGRSPDGEMVIECHTVLMNFDEHDVPDEVYEAHVEEEVEYYERE